MTQLLTRVFRRRRPTPPLPQIAAVDIRKVTSDQRLRLHQWLDSDETKFALSLIESTKPSVFISPKSTPDMDSHSTLRRLCQLQGWETYRNTLLGLRYTKEEIKQIVEETYGEPQE